MARDLTNLAELLRETNRPSEAEPLSRRALAIYEKIFGPDHPEVALNLNNLAALLQDTNRLVEAEPLYRRALAIDEKSLGPDHSRVARDLNNLAVLLHDTNRIAEAEQLARRALAIKEKSLGPNHPGVALVLNNLAALLEEQGRWSDAVALQRRAAPIMTSAESAVIRRAIRAKFSGALGNYAQALYHADANEAGNFAEAFEAAQWAQQNEAADALSAMSARFAASGSQLAKLVRDQQDLIAERERAYKTLDAAAGKADAKGAEAARAAITAIETKLAAAEERLGREFPDFAALTSPKPLGLQETQALLGDGEALVLFLDRMPVGQLPEETIVFSLTNKESRWISMPSGRHVFQDRVAALRCGLDRTAWRVEEQGRTLPGKAAETSQQKCMRLLNTNATEDQTLPFDAAAAHALYRDLFGGIEDIIKDKALIVVTSGPLTQLPFEVLVTRLENEGASGLRQKDVAALVSILKTSPRKREKL